MRPAATWAAAFVLLALLPACGGPDAAEDRGGTAGSDGAALQEAPAGARDTGAGAAAGEDGRPGQARQAADGAADTAASGDGASGGAPLTTIRVAGIPVRVEVADDPEERRRGLMHRDSLPEDQGMLFVYPEERTLSFWMRETRIPLDIAYIDRSGFIVDIQSMEPHSEELHPSRQPAMYALEMNRGWFEAHGVEAGDRVAF